LGVQKNLTICEEDMKNEKIDRRVKYTTMLLRESLIRLMETYPISRISVKMLCEDADINRSTFYAHYIDQYDLLHKNEQEFLTEFRDYLRMQPTAEQSIWAEKIMQQLFEYVGNNASLFRVLLSENGDPEFQSSVMALAQEKIISSLRSDPDIDSRTSDYMQSFIIAGALKVLQKWIQDGAIESSQQMAKLVSNLLFQGISSYF
jgi:hypothetical protein